MLKLKWASCRDLYWQDNLPYSTLGWAPQAWLGYYRFHVKSWPPLTGFCTVEDEKCGSAETHGYLPVIREGWMETPLGGKGWGPYLLLQGTFSVPSTTRKVQNITPPWPWGTVSPACLCSPLSVLSPPWHRPGSHFSPSGLSAPAPAAPQQGQSPCLAMGCSKLSPHVSWDVFETWGWGCPKV